MSGTKLVCQKELEMPLLSISSQDTIAKCAAFELDQKDVFICSYPKSGTTWLQHVVISLLLSHLETIDVTPPPYKHVSDYAPFFEINPHWDGNQLVQRIRENHSRIGRRVFNTHLRFDMLPTAGVQGKFIYIARSPLDTCVSFFHHLSHQVEGGFDGDFDSFYRLWLDGSIAYGTWADHVTSYTVGVSSGTEKNQTIRLHDGREVLLLLYEDMVADLPRVVGLLLDFLELNVSDERQRELMPTFRFDAMKANLSQFQPQSVQWRNQFSFLRQGQCGDGRRQINEQQRLEFMRSVDTGRVQHALSHSTFASFRNLATLVEQSK